MADTAIKTKDIQEEWRLLAESNPEIEKIRTKGEWLLWRQNHPEKNTHEGLWELHQAISFASKKLEEKEPEKKEEKEKHDDSHNFHIESKKDEDEDEDEDENEDEEKEKKDQSQSINKRDLDRFRRAMEEAENKPKTPTPQARSIPQESFPRPKPSVRGFDTRFINGLNNLFGKLRISGTSPVQATRAAGQAVRLGAQAARFGGMAARAGGQLAVSAGGGVAAGAAAISGPALVVIIAIIAVILLIIVIFIVFTGGPGGTSPKPIAGSCPDTSSNVKSCRYLNPGIDLFQTTISSDALNSYITKYSPVFIRSGGNLSEFTKRVNYIVGAAQQAGLNPAIFLGYWKSESNFSTIGTRDMGCVGDDFYEQVDCALGIDAFRDPVKNPIANCAKSKDANSLACITLRGIRKNLDIDHPVSYPIATLDDFAESYGPYSHLVSGIPTNCTHTYNILIEVSKELGACQGSVSSGELSSCPVSSNRITYPSYQADSKNGHCTSSAEGVCTPSCPFDNRRAKSIDVDTSGNKDVVLPTLNDKIVSWKFIQAICAGAGAYPNCISYNGGTGGMFTFEGTIPGETDKWYIQFVHMVTPSLLSLNETYPSGTIVGKTDVNIVHISIGKNIGSPLGSGSPTTDCDPGWIPADVGLKMCTK